MYWNHSRLKNSMTCQCDNTKRICLSKSFQIITEDICRHVLDQDHPTIANMGHERLVPLILSSWNPSQWEDSMQPAENDIWVMQERDSKRISETHSGMHFSKHETEVLCCKSRVLSPICSNSLRYKYVWLYDYSYSTCQAWKLGARGPVTDLGKKIVAALAAVH